MEKIHIKLRKKTIVTDGFFISPLVQKIVKRMYLPQQSQSIPICKWTAEMKRSHAWSCFRTLPSINGRSRWKIAFSISIRSPTFSHITLSEQRRQRSESWSRVCLKSVSCSLVWKFGIIYKSITKKWER